MSPFLQGRFLTGSAGTGKTFTYQERMRNGDEGIKLCSTTGISAINLGAGVSTIHSLLGFFDDKSLADRFYTGRLTHKFYTLLAEEDMRELVLDECFDYHQPILTENGWRAIGKIVKGREAIKVVTRTATGNFVLAPITGWHARKAPTGLLDIVVGHSDSKRARKQIRCTQNHKVLTKTGWKSAKDLLLGEHVAVRAASLTPLQQSLLFGGLLGDSSLCRGKTRVSPQLRITHGEKQLAYLKEKQRVFGSLSSRLRTGKSGYAPNNKIFSFSVATLGDMWDARYMMIPVVNGRRGEWIPTDEFLSHVDTCALAVWFMDDGSTSKQTTKIGTNYYASLHCSMFAEDTQHHLASWMRKRFGLTAKVSPDSRGGFYLRFSAAETTKLFTLIGPHCPSCMKWKVPTAAARWVPQKPLEQAWYPVRSINEIAYTGENVYDLTVPETHNYVAGGVVVHNCSMFSADALEIIWKAFEEASERWRKASPDDWTKPTLVLLGDACQLPPVGDKVRWFHEADIWEDEFAPNTTRLTKIWRQSNPTFLAALAAARTGNGPEAARLLQACGVEFSNQVDAGFAGSTLVGTNEKMNRYNFLRLKQVEGPTFAMKSSRWTVPGQNPPAEWEHIPEVDYLRPGALVMIKANDIPGWRYANGDLATVIGWDREQKAWKLELKRSGEEVFIGRIMRQIESRDIPAWIKTDKQALSPEEGRTGQIPFRNSNKAWVLGEIEYFPLKLAYSTTTHSSQGLTLDAVQIDVREAFMGSPATCYVALSRCRTPEGLRIVGTPELLGKRIKIHEKARAWA